MVVNNPHTIDEGDYVKPRYNREKFLNIWREINKNRFPLVIEENYNELLRGEYKGVDGYYDSNYRVNYILVKRDNSELSVFVPEILLRKIIKQ